MPRDRSNLPADLSSPASGILIVVPSDDNDLPPGCRGISIAEAGSIAVVMHDDSEEVIPEGALAVGVQHGMRVKRVKATGTDVGAGMIVAWY
jgi:hypothetical protein